MKPVLNIADLALDIWQQGEKYAGADASFGARLGLSGLGISYNEVPPGKSGCPFHNHHVEDEMFIVLEGEGTYRFGAETYPVRAGDVLGAPAGGQETAHQIINTGTVPLRYYGISTVAATEVCEYPDSGKYQVSSRPGASKPARYVYEAAAGRVKHIGHAGEHNIDYWKDEPGA